MSVLTRKQQWRRAGHGNKYLRNMNMDNYFDHCDLPIRAFSDTALTTRTEDIVLRSPMRSSITTGNIDSLKSGQPFRARLKKKVCFDTCVRVILITSRGEYMQAGMYSTLWYKHEDYIEFKKETLKDLASISIDILKNVNNNDDIHEEIFQFKQENRQIQVKNNTSENKNGENINTGSLSSSLTNAEGEKRTSISHVSGLDKLVEMYKDTDCSNGDSGKGRDDHILRNNDHGNRDSIDCDAVPLERELIDSIVEKGEQKARKQAILSRRLAEEQLNNQQYIAKNPLTLMCT